MERSTVSLVKVERTAQEYAGSRLELGKAKRALRAAMAEAYQRDGDTIAAMASVSGGTRRRAAQVLRAAESKV